MNCLRIIVGALLIVIVAARSFAANTKTNMTDDIPIISVKALYDHAKEFDGELVRVVGYYYNNPPTSALFPDRGAFKRKDSMLCLWIGADKSHSVAEGAKRKNKKWVVVQGRFKAGGIGILDQYFGQISEVSEFVILNEE